MERSGENFRLLRQRNEHTFWSPLPATYEIRPQDWSNWSWRYVTKTSCDELPPTNLPLAAVSVAEYSGRMFSPNTFLARLRPKEYKQVSESTLNATLKDVHDLVQFLAVKIQKVVWGQDLGNTFAVPTPSSYRMAYPWHSD